MWVQRTLWESRPGGPTLPSPLSAVALGAETWRPRPRSPDA